MKKKVLQHKIESESRKAFANLIPNGWVINDFNEDYGKDMHIEIFRNDIATGLSFICQLKGSSQGIKNNEIKISIEVNDLTYFKSLTQPILLAFYSTQTKTYWAMGELSSRQSDLKSEPTVLHHNA